MHDYAVRAATDADIPAIVELARLSLGASALTTEAYWRWKHTQSPFGHSPTVVATAPDGSLVGVRVFMRWQWTSAERTLEALRAVDTATHPDWRRRGIFQRLTLGLVEQATAEGTAFVFNTPNDQSRPGYLKMGWHDVTRVPVRVLALRPLRALTRAAAARHGHFAVGESRFGDDGSMDALLADPRLTDVLDRLETLDERYHTHVTPAYLRWRFAEIPELHYRARWHFNGADGGVVIARRRARGGLDETDIACVLATPGVSGRRLARKALVDMCGESRSDYAIASAACGSAEYQVLREGLFVGAPAGLGPRLVVRELGVLPSPDPFAWSSWRCQIGDLELF